jgi:hypothetical protein
MLLMALVVLAWLGFLIYRDHARLTTAKSWLYTGPRKREAFDILVEAFDDFVELWILAN